MSAHLNTLINFIAGLTYGVFAWGIDAFLLLRSNYTLPWLKLLIALVPAILIIISAGRLAAKYNHIVMKTLVWVAAASVLCALNALIAFQGTEAAYKLLLPEIGGRLNYVATEGIKSRLFIIIIMTNILFILGGLLTDLASEAPVTSSGTFGWIFPILFCLAFFAAAGFITDANFNAELRENVISIDNQIDEAAQNMQKKNLTEWEQRIIQRFTKLDVDLQGKRNLLIESFDESFSQARILINFNDVWAECLSLNGRVGSCERLEL